MIVFLSWRSTLSFYIQANNGQIPPVASRKPIAGLLGMVSLISGPYLLVVTRKVPKLNIQHVHYCESGKCFRPGWVSCLVGRFGGWLKLKLSAMPGLNTTLHLGIELEVVGGVYYLVLRIWRPEPVFQTTKIAQCSILVSWRQTGSMWPWCSR